jgi:hypothetical protein
VQDRGPLSPSSRVFERYDSMNERDQAKNNLEAKWLDTKLCLNNGLWDCTFAFDDEPEKQGMNSFQPSPIYLCKAWSPNLLAIEYCGLDNHLH